MSKTIMGISFLSLNQVKELTSWSDEYLAAKIRDGELRAQRFGRYKFVAEQELKNYLQYGSANQLDNLIFGADD